MDEELRALTGATIDEVYITPYGPPSPWSFLRVRLTDGRMLEITNTVPEDIQLVSTQKPAPPPAQMATIGGGDFAAYQHGM